MHRIYTSLILLLIAAIAAAADPTATTYSWAECQGSARPYPAPQAVTAHPDSLTPIMINHVGRHGARFAANNKHYATLLNALEQAKKLGTITPTGKTLATLIQQAINRTAGRWGALDSLGMAEQRGIAARLCAAYPSLIRNSRVEALSSYAPRCIMSMYEFTHQISRMDNHVEIYTSSGRQNSELMRFFDLSEDYRLYRESDALKNKLAEYTAQTITYEPLKRILGDKYPLDETASDVAMAQYSALAGLAAMGMTCDITQYFTTQEYNALWGIFNLRQYLQRTASTLSSVPADIASPLLLDLIHTTDKFIADSTSMAPIQLRFGHAETLMPLLSLMHLKGCYYLTNYFDTVGLHWRDFHIVPMAANLQLILFRSQSGELYLRTDLNEVPVPLIPNESTIYVPWQKARAYLERCVPIYY